MIWLHACNEPTGHSAHTEIAVMVPKAEKNLACYKLLRKALKKVLLALFEGKGVKA